MNRLLAVALAVGNLAVSDARAFVVAGEAGFEDCEAFCNPDAIFSPAYLWMWNAPLTKESLDRHLDEMAAKGLRAVVPVAFPKGFRPTTCRSEMTPDYLTREYLEAYSGVIRKAKSLGLHVWLFDEGGWPSGSACNLVAASDSDGLFRVRYLARDEPTGRLELKCEPYGGDWGNMPSLVEPGATERFLQLTHEAYLKSFGEEFGKTVRICFTDEPTRPTARAGKIPWASDFDEQFRRRKGYDLRPLAASLLEDSDHMDETSTRVRIDYEDVMSQIFIERYLAVLQSWCRAHGVAHGGHLDKDDTPELALRYGQGSALRSLRSFDVPGVDTIWRQLFPKTAQKEGRVAPFPRYAASSAHQNGGNVVLSESFCIYGDSLAPEHMKWVVDCQMVRGVTTFVLGYYLLSNAGQWMTLVEPHSGPVQPYWDFQEPFFRYVHRMCGLLARGRSAAEIAVVFDARDFWAGGEECEEAAAAHYGVSAELDRLNCDFDFIDDDQIAAASFAGGKMQVGKMSYSTVVLPRSHRILPAARAKLEAFKVAGGHVIGRKGLRRVPRTARISGEGSEDIRVLKRVDGKSSLYFLVNESLSPRTVGVSFDEGMSNIRLADALSGKMTRVNAAEDGLLWKFPPASSAVFIVGGTDGPCEQGSSVAGPSRPVSGWKARKLVEHALGEKDFEVRSVMGSPLEPIDLGDWREKYGSTFSGRVQYQATFDAERAGHVRIDLGDVRGCARVTLNGRVAGTCFFAPFVVEANVQTGENSLVVEVANTLGNAISSGADRDRIAREYPPESYYDRFQRPMDKEFNESGLYGPVTVTPLEFEGTSPAERP